MTLAFYRKTHIIATFGAQLRYGRHRRTIRWLG